MPIIYYRCEEMDLVFENLQNIPVNLEEVIAGLHKSTAWIDKDVHNRKGVFAEHLARYKLREVCNQPKYKSTLNPTPFMIEPTTISVIYGEEGVHMQYGRNFLIQIDAMVMIDKIPVPVEIKSSKHLDDAENPRRDAELDYLITHFYRQDGKFGHALLMPSPTHIDRGQSHQKLFVQKNGIVAAYCPNVHLFEQDLKYLESKLLSTPSQKT